ncbi:TackOD1 domain-containing metal-binding protein [Phyllobacterium sp. K27]
MSNSNVSLLENTAPLENRAFIDRHPVVDQCQSVWQQFGLRTPQAAFYPDTIIPHSRYLREVFSVVDNDDIDAILLTNEREAFGLERFRSARDLFLVPVVNVSGKPSVAADVDFSLKNPKSWLETASCIRKFRDRRGRLSSRFLSPTAPAMRMMAYLFVSGEDLTLIRQPSSPYYFAYKGFPNTSSATMVAEALANKGWLERSFFDRYHKCAGCQSHRLTVREECPACQSPQLSEAALIHHYSCAQLSPEADFRRGTTLICPKCSMQLRHYGKDYDKPGQVQVCTQCKNTTSEPSIGFLCQDCGMHVGGDAVGVSDVFSYSLSHQATALLANDVEDVNRFPIAQLRYLPEDLQRKLLSLNGAASDFMLAEVQYGSREQIVKTRGEDNFISMRKLLADNLQGVLGEVASVYSSREREYVLFLGRDETGFAAYLQEALDQAEAVLSDKLTPTLLVLWGTREKALS